jgi:hypothetical protein
VDEVLVVVEEVEQVPHATAQMFETSNGAPGTEGSQNLGTIISLLHSHGSGTPLHVGVVVVIVLVALVAEAVVSVIVLSVTDESVTVSVTVDADVSVTDEVVTVVSVIDEAETVVPVTELTLDSVAVLTVVSVAVVELVVTQVPHMTGQVARVLAPVNALVQRVEGGLNAAIVAQPGGSRFPLHTSVRVDVDVVVESGHVPQSK